MNKQPTSYRLAERLFQIGVIEHAPSEICSLSAEEAADRIKAGCCDWAICDRGPDGKPLTFAAYHAAVYGAESEYAGKGRKRA